jgi:poly-beta-1,6-N-acetyl-D-glucosamine biosynthesis protein PgaD
MKFELIINSSRSANFRTRARDWILFLACWIMWAAVLFSVGNGTEWSRMSEIFANWFYSQSVFISSVLSDFHVSRRYLLMVGLLMCGLLLWSAMSKSRAWRRPRMSRMRSAPLALEEMARQFCVDAALIRAMQSEQCVVIHHAASGAVSDMHPKRHNRGKQVFDDGRARCGVKKFGQAGQCNPVARPPVQRHEKAPKPLRRRLPVMDFETI